MKNKDLANKIDNLLETLKNTKDLVNYINISTVTCIACSILYTIIKSFYSYDSISFVVFLKFTNIFLKTLVPALANTYTIIIVLKAFTGFKFISKLPGVGRIVDNSLTEGIATIIICVLIFIGSTSGIDF